MIFNPIPSLKLTGTKIIIDPSELWNNDFNSDDKSNNSLIIYHHPECFNIDDNSKININSPLTNH